MGIKQEAMRILANLTLEEKIGQVTQIIYNGEPLEEMREKIKKIKPGSFILCNSSLGGREEQREVVLKEINDLQRVAVEETPNGIPFLFGRDVIHGHRVVFPVPLTMTASFDFDFIEQCYDAIREEAVNDGINWTFAPMIDLCREHRWGRIIEGTGEDPFLGECFAKAVVKGFQTENMSNERSVLACAKHFVGYGASEGGRDYNHTEISDYSLQNYYLPAFRAAVDSGVATVMSAFNDINGIPATSNEHTMTEILRDQMGFEGFVISDWNAIERIYLWSGYTPNKEEAAEAALKAGVDMDMVDNCYLDCLAGLIKSGKLPESVLDKAVLRILETKLRAGLFEHPYLHAKPYDMDEHIKMAQVLAEKSIVLLKNDHQILPLKAGAKIGVCGPMANKGTELVGSWALDGDLSLSRNIADCLAETFDVSELIECNEQRTSVFCNTEATVVVLGESKKVTGEATALANIGIPETQLALLKRVRKIGKPVIGVFCFARPICFGEYDDLFDAILYAGHGGSRAAEAIAAILCGEAEPEGRLPFTLPYAQGQMPLYYNALPGSQRINGYYNDVNPAHQNYCDCKGSPNYPFGYGLSYTQFSFSEIQCKKREIKMEDIEAGNGFRFSVVVSNIGNRKGIAVPQLYVRDPVGSRIRPLRMLKGFFKIDLQPGESQTVDFTLSKSELGYYLENGDFILEKGDFHVFIGENCLTENKITIAVS